MTKRKDGRWEVAVIDRTTGRRRRQYEKTIAGARATLKEMLSRADSGTPITDSGVTLSAYVEVWLADRAGRRRRESTVREYAWRLSKYVLPVLGGLRVKAIHVHHVEDLLDGIAAQGLSRSTVRAVRNALAAVLSDAVRARHLAVNVAAQAQIPEGASIARATRAPTSLEVQGLLQVASGTDIEPLLVLLMGTGARIGEALGMKWSDLDTASKAWTVARTVTRDARGAVVIGERTKTGESRRLWLPDEVMDALLHQRRMVARAKIAAVIWQDHDLVFPTVIGTAQDPRNVRKVLRPLAASAGFPGSFHALRHHFASVAVTTAPDVTVSKLLGHAKTATTTDLYAHLRDDDAVRIAVAVSVAVKQAGRQT